GVVVAGDAQVGQQISEFRDREIQVHGPVAQIRPERDSALHQFPNLLTYQLTNYQLRHRPRYSIHRVGRTSPIAGSSTSALRPRRSVRPASACSKNRFCSSTSPSTTSSIFACLALGSVSTRGRQRSTKACASRISSSSTARAAAAPLPLIARLPSVTSGAMPPSSAIAAPIQGG